jgi:hypothetical protein
METATLRLKRDRRAQPRIRPRDTTRTIPEDGDVVVRQERRDGALAYVLHTAPGAHQYLLRTRAEAVAHALAFAEGHRMCAWLMDEAHDSLLLGDFRVATQIQDVLIRLRAEFLEMPGLRLTRAQVARLFGVEGAVCQVVLDVLVDEKFLCTNPDGHYARLTDETRRRSRPVKADFGTGRPSLKAS